MPDFTQSTGIPGIAADYVSMAELFDTGKGSGSNQIVVGFEGESDLDMHQVGIAHRNSQGGGAIRIAGVLVVLAGEAQGFPDCGNTAMPPAPSEEMAASAGFLYVFEEILVPGVFLQDDPLGFIIESDAELGIEDAQPAGIDLAGQGVDAEFFCSAEAE